MSEETKHQKLRVCGRYSATDGR